LLKDIHFDFDKYDIRPGDAEILKANAAVLARNPNAKIQIEGHCDERGTGEYNLALGERRANSTKSYLTSLGISTNRLSTIRNANRIVVLDGGMIIQQGQHEELLNQGGLYKKLYLSQQLYKINLF
jgi:hypothetical protein